MNFLFPYINKETRIITINIGRWRQSPPRRVILAGAVPNEAFAYYLHTDVGFVVWVVCSIFHAGVIGCLQSCDMCLGYED